MTTDCQHPSTRTECVDCGEVLHEGITDSSYTDLLTAARAVWEGAEPDSESSVWGVDHALLNALRAAVLKAEGLQ